MSNSDSDGETPGGGQRHLAVKVVIVGDGASGKTCLATRCVKSEFGPEYKQTLGVDFLVRKMTLGIDERTEKNATVKIWDIGGQTIGGRMLPNYLFDADVVLFVYDMTNSESFRNLEQWVTAVKTIVDDRERLDAEEGKRKIKMTHFTLVANKSDMDFQRSVTREEHVRFTKSHGMPGHYVSAKTGENVEAMFKTCVARALGIRMSKRELETAGAQQAMVAPIMADDPEAASAATAASESSRASFGGAGGRSQRKSSICNLQ